MPSPSSGGGLTVVPVVGLGEVEAGTDLAGLLLDALTASGVGLRPGDCLVVSSKVVSKALGLTWAGPREDAVAAGTVRVVAERRGADAVTRVVESVAGPVMAAAGVDASNTGPSARLLVLPEDPDAEAARLRARPARPARTSLCHTAGRRAERHRGAPVARRPDRLRPRQRGAGRARGPARRAPTTTVVRWP